MIGASDARVLKTIPLVVILGMSVFSTILVSAPAFAVLVDNHLSNKAAY